MGVVKRSSQEKCDQNNKQTLDQCIKHVQRTYVREHICDIVTYYKQHHNLSAVKCK